MQEAKDLPTEIFLKLVDLNRVWGKKIRVFP